MSLGIYPVFKPELVGTQFNGLGEVLVSNLEALEKISRPAKITSLTAFGDNRPVPDDFDGAPDDLAEVLGEWTEWFSPVEGQVAIQTLADHIKNSPRATKRLDGAEDVIAELEEIARLLEAAAAQGAQFRLELLA